MEEKCFCHYNGYAVKDAYARRKLDNSAIVAALGAKISETTGADGFGTCIVMHDDKTCIIFDFGNDEGVTLNAYLQKNEIKTIDAIYISHFHSDHYQLTTLQSLISRYTINSIVLPHATIDWNRAAEENAHHEARYNEAKAAAVAAGIPCWEPVKEGTAFQHGDFSVTCHNVAPELLEGYYSWMFDSYYAEYDYPMYNNFSMVNAVTYRNQKIIVTGDIMEPAVENTLEVLSTADLIFVPHHGLDVAVPYAAFNRLSAKHAVVNHAYDPDGETVRVSLAFAGELLKHGCRVTTTFSEAAAINAIYEIKDGNINPIEPGVLSGAEIMPCALKPGTDLDLLPAGEFITYTNAAAGTMLHKPKFSAENRKFKITVKTVRTTGADKEQEAAVIDTSFKPEIARRITTGGKYGEWNSSNMPGYVFWSYSGVSDFETLKSKLDDFIIGMDVGQTREVLMSGAADSPFGGGVWLVRASVLYPEYVVVDVSGYTGGGRFFKMVKSAGVWDEPEWINPSMTPDMEYRTTERWNGKPVYVKAISFPDLPASGDKWVPCGVIAENVIDVDGFCLSASGSFYKFPIFAGTTPKSYVYINSSQNLIVHANDDLSSYTGATFTIKYTK